jgi:hypothetical protein
MAGEVQAPVANVEAPELSPSPAARLITVMELLYRGLISRETAAHLLDMPVIGPEGPFDNGSTIKFYSAERGDDGW